MAVLFAREVRRIVLEFAERYKVHCVRGASITIRMDTEGRKSIS